MLTNKLHRFSFRLPSLIRQQTIIAKDNQNHEPSSEKIIHDQHLSNIIVKVLSNNLLLKYDLILSYL